MPLLSFDPISREPPLNSSDDQPIVIGLVNNMPSAALRITELQFCSLLSVAAGNIPVHLRLFYLPEIPRKASDRSFVDYGYQDISELWSAHIDGLIVTGTEPRAAALVDEPYWPTLTKLIDWTEDHTVSTIWSCLAAHAAVLYIDGIHRCALGEKLFGIFECTKAEDHTLMVNAPSRWCVPHSRYNGLPEEVLARHGYRVLSRSPDAGADMFVKQRKSLFIFFQGHPEYDSRTLLREYRRDIRRFLAGDRTNYPEMPQNYFDNETTNALAEFREQVLKSPDIGRLSTAPAVAEERLIRTWQEFAIQFYCSWFLYLMEHRMSICHPAILEGLHKGTSCAHSDSPVINHLPSKV